MTDRESIRDRARRLLGPAPPLPKSTGLVPRPNGPDDMVDPRSVELERFLKKLPRRDRLAVMSALAFAFPRLGRDPAWQRGITHDRKMLGGSDAEWSGVLSEAARIVLDLHAEFVRAQNAGREKQA